MEKGGGLPNSLWPSHSSCQQGILLSAKTIPWFDFERRSEVRLNIYNLT